MSHSLSLEKVKCIGTKWKYCVLGYVRDAQTLWNTDNPYYQIPELIQFIILLFFYNPIQSKILNDAQCDQLLSLFDKEDKFKNLGAFSYDLLWRVSKDGSDETKFKEKCHGQPNLLCIIETENLEGRYIIGGYTCRGWPKTTKSMVYFEDDDAFLVYIHNTETDLPMKIFNAKKGKEALRVQDGYVLIFGQDCSIWVNISSGNGALEATGIDYQDIPKEYWINGDKFGDFEVREIEIYQLK